MNRIRIEVISDFICPWCYLGVTRLERIRKELSTEIAIDFHLKPYLLYPQIPSEGSPKQLFAKKTRPGMGKALKAEAQKEEILIDYKKIERIPNSLEAHRLISLVDDPSLQWRFTLSIFKAYFEEGLDIGSPSVLMDIGNRLNIENEIFNQFSDSELGLDMVKKEIDNAKQNFVTVVPTLLIDQKLTMSGLQEDILWKRYFKKAAMLQNSMN
jgi:predicted DsbA family dithiol-disulfide isomerase